MKRTPLDIIHDVFQPDGEDLGDGADLRNLPNWDSLNHMNLIAALENEYKIVFSGDEVAEMLSLDAINRILREHHGLQL